MFAPTYPLRTARLDLRPAQPSDRALLREIYTDPAVLRYLYDEVHSEDDVTARLARQMARVALRHEGDALNPVAVLRESGAAVGTASLGWLSETHRCAEVGFVVLPRFQGRGFAVEMAAEMLRVAFEDVDVHRVIGRCDARNAGSVAVMERLGMRREAQLVQNEWVKGEWCDELDYAILADEWRARAGTMRA